MVHLQPYLLMRMGGRNREDRRTALYSELSVATPRPCSL
jgi:hypothetical protein